MPVRGPTEKPAPSGRCIAGASLPQPYSTCSPCEMVFSGPTPHGLRMWQSHTGFLLAGVSQPALDAMRVDLQCCGVRPSIHKERDSTVLVEEKQVWMRTEEQHMVSYLLLGERFDADQLQSLIRQLHRRAQVRLWCTQRFMVIRCAPFYPRGQLGSSRIARGMSPEQGGGRTSSCVTL